MKRAGCSGWSPTGYPLPCTPRASSTPWSNSSTARSSPSLGVPDMRIPIAYALSYPDRMPENNLSLDIFNKAARLEFFPPDTDKFPCLNLAYEALGKGGTMTAVLNAANEVAVEAFLAGKISFSRLPEIIRATMSRHEVNKIQTVSEVIEADAWARRTAWEITGNQ